MFVLNYNPAYRERSFVFHGRVLNQQFRTSELVDYAMGEGRDMLGGTYTQTLGEQFCSDLQSVGAALDPHPQQRLIAENTASRLLWLQETFPTAGAYQMVYEAFDFYQNVFGALCPEIYPAFFSLLEAEAILYAQPKPKPYREHLAHPVYVFLAGRRILDDRRN